MKRLTLMVSGDAENLPDGRVKVVAEGEDEKLKLLKYCADIKNTLINVKNIESSISEASDEFSDFFKMVKEGETDERLDKAAELLKELIEVNRNGFSALKDDTSAMLEKQDKMLEKQDKMLDKQDITIHILEKVSDDSSEMRSSLSRIEDKQDRSVQLLETIKEDTFDMRSTLSRTESDIKDTKFSLSAFIEEKYQKLEGEIAEIKATLARMQAAG